MKKCSKRVPKCDFVDFEISFGSGADLRNFPGTFRRTRDHKNQITKNKHETCNIAKNKLPTPPELREQSKKVSPAKLAHFRPKPAPTPNLSQFAPTPLSFHPPTYCRPRGLFFFDRGLVVPCEPFFFKTGFWESALVLPFLAKFKGPPPPPPRISDFC